MQMKVEQWEASDEVNISSIDPSSSELSAKKLVWERGLRRGEAENNFSAE